VSHSYSRLLAACVTAEQKGRDLLTPQLRHWYAFNGTLSGTPEWACLESCPLSEITSFELDSSRSRKSVIGFDLHSLFRNESDSTLRASRWQDNVFHFFPVGFGTMRGL